jgi:uncharacterized membrane protein
MVRQLKEAKRWNETLFLGFVSLACFSLSVFRYIYSDSVHFLFLNWNLFLAFIPWFFSSIITIYPSLRKRKLAISVLVLFWLLFFPNAPYILTDLFHLKWAADMPIWFDLVLILSFAWTGLLFGILSLWDIEQILAIRIPKKLLPFVTTFLLFVGSFGIFAGRYLRWNSWDIVKEPLGMLYQLKASMVSPYYHPKPYGMTLFMGLFLMLVYWSFHFIRTRVNGPGPSLEPKDKTE